MTYEIQLTTPRMCRLGMLDMYPKFRFYEHLNCNIEEYKRVQRELFPEEFI